MRKCDQNSELIYQSGNIRYFLLKTLKKGNALSNDDKALLNNPFYNMDSTLLGQNENNRFHYFPVAACAA